MRWSTSTRSTRKRKYMLTSSSSNSSMEVVPWEDYIRLMGVAMGVRIMGTTTTTITLGMARDLGVGAVGLIQRVAIRGAWRISRGIETLVLGG